MLVIRQPWIMNMATMGCTSKMESANQTPPGMASWIHPCDTQYAISASRPSVVGIGVPSKYAALPVASLGMSLAVTLKRASLVSPQRTKKARQRWSSGVRKPIANATIAGETPNEIW